MGVGLGSEPAPVLERERIRFEAFQHVLVVVRIDDDRNAVVILARGADHRRSADIDVLDGVVDRRVVARNGLLEGIEVDDEEIDRLDRVFLHRRLVRAAPAQEAAVDFRMQRLDPAVHDLRKAGLLRDFDRVDAGVTDRFRGPAGRHDLDTEFPESPDERLQSALVRDADERTSYRKHTAPQCPV